MFENLPGSLVAVENLMNAARVGEPDPLGSTPPDFGQSFMCHDKGAWLDVELANESCYHRDPALTFVRARDPKRLKYVLDATNWQDIQAT
jgi:hypothetical protein